jgi:hypothetical protein
MTISRSGYNARLDVDDRVLVKRVHLMVASTLMLVSACACSACLRSVAYERKVRLTRAMGKR